MNFLKYALILLFCSILLSSCAAASVAAPAIADLVDCAQPGTVQMLSVDAANEIGLYLPPCYDPETDQVYPVLYLLPGFGGAPNDWLDAGLADLADDLMLGGEVPPFMIVTTDDSFNDLDAAFVMQQIIPYVESHYQASPSRQHRAVAGGSLGGASAYHLAFKAPDIFESAGIFGNGAAVGEEDAILTWLAAIPNAVRPRVFMSSGDNDPYMQERARVLIDLLDESGVAHAEIFETGDHTYVSWLSSFPAYFRWLAQGWALAHIR